jgi:hypothetical protein
MSIVYNSVMKFFQKGNDPKERDLSHYLEVCISLNSC